MADKRIIQLVELEPRPLEMISLVGMVTISLSTASIWLIIGITYGDGFGWIMGGLQASTTLTFLWGIKDRTNSITYKKVK